METPQLLRELLPDGPARSGPQTQDLTNDVVGVPLKPGQIGVSQH
ncbi:hypothetical protein [Streptomyces sp. NPDC002722]